MLIRHFHDTVLRIHKSILNYALKSTLRCKERPLGYIEISFFCPCGAGLGYLRHASWPSPAFTCISLFIIQDPRQKTISLIMHRPLIIHIMHFIRCDFFHFFFRNYV